MFFICYIKVYSIKNEYMSESEVENERPRKMADLGPRKFEGIGPTTRDGMPIVLRSVSSTFQPSINRVNKF